MAWTLINTDNPARFVTSTGSFTYTLPSGAPTSGQLDVIGLSTQTNTFTTASSGWTSGNVINTTGGGNCQGIMWWKFAGASDPSTVTFNLSSSAATEVLLCWQRWSGGLAADIGASAGNSTNAMNTPSVSTGALAGTGELSVAMCYGNNGALPSPINWSTGYTGAGSTSDGFSGLCAFHGYKTTAGASAETPQATWASNVLNAQAIMVQTFTPASSGSSVSGAVSALALASAAGSVGLGPNPAPVSPLALTALPGSLTFGAASIPGQAALLALAAPAGSPPAFGGDDDPPWHVRRRRG